MTGEIAKLQGAISKNESLIRLDEADLQKPETYQGSHNDTRHNIDVLNGYNINNNANIINTQSSLENVKKCSLMSDTVANLYRAGCVACLEGIAPFRYP